MKKYIILPDEVNLILSIYKEYGSIAYVVGGCVRDSLLNREVHDWDICTPVAPGETISLFNEKGFNVIETGLQHGTVTVVINKKTFEITTYRRDGKYSDSRHPDSIEFTSELAEDLSRRDFTMNAIAYNPDTGIIDPFGGRRDIEMRRIKCVGNPNDRFDEDPLRIMRGIRFAAQLGFAMNLETKITCINKSPKLKLISAERKRDELCKFLMSDRLDLKDVLDEYRNVIFKIIPELHSCQIQQENPYHWYSVYWHTVVAVCEAPKDLIIRLSLLLHDIGKPQKKTYEEKDGKMICHYYGHAEYGAELANQILRKLKFDNETRESVVELIRYHDVQIPPKKKAIKRWLNKIGQEQFRRLIEVRAADIKAQNLKYINRLEIIKKVEEKFKEILEQNECFTLKDLEVNGNDLIALGFKPGKEIGYTLNRLLLMVMQEVVPNEKDFLLDCADEILKGKEWR